MRPMTSRSPAETPASSRAARRGASSFGWWMDAAAVALFTAVVLGLLLLSVESPFYADDYSNLVTMRDHAFLHGPIHVYLTWSGRLSPSVFLEVALRYPLLWGIANGAAFVALVVLTFAVAMGRWPRIARRDLQVVAVVLAAYWFALPVIGETVFWRTGAAVYLWPMWLMLLFVFPYRRWVSSPTSTADLGWVRRVAASLGCFVLGFVVGCSHEQLIVALCVLFVAFAVKVWQRGLRTVPVALVAGVVGAALGAAVLLLAPGNEVRLAAVGVVSLTVFERVRGFAAYLASILIHRLPPLIPWLFCGLLAAVPMRGMGEGRSNDAARPRAWLVWALAGVATLAPFVIMPGNGAERTFFFLPVFLTVCVLSLSAGGKRRALDCLPSAATSIVIAGLMLCVLAPMAGSVRRAMLLTEATHQREQLVRAQKARGVVDVVVPPIEGSLNRAVTFSDLTSDPEFWTNEAMADWYGVHTIVVSGEATLP